MNYESMVYVYGWLMEEHQPIGIDFQPIRDDYSEDSMTQHYMEFNEDREVSQDFGITLFLKQSSINPIRSIRQPLTRRGERNSSRGKI